MSHYETKWDTKHYNFGFGKFKSLQEFHDHMLMQPLVAGESGETTLTTIICWVVILLNLPCGGFSHISMYCHCSTQSYEGAVLGLVQIQQLKTNFSLPSFQAVVTPISIFDDCIHICFSHFQVF